MSKYLDKVGLTHLVSLLKRTFSKDSMGMVPATQAEETDAVSQVLYGDGTWKELPEQFEPVVVQATVTPYAGSVVGIRSFETSLAKAGMGLIAYSIPGGVQTTEWKIKIADGNIYFSGAASGASTALLVLGKMDGVTAETEFVIPAPMSVMKGASSSSSGQSGTVPQPKYGDQDKVLTGGGVWKAISQPFIVSYPVKKTEPPPPSDDDIIIIDPTDGNLVWSATENTVIIGHIIPPGVQAGDWSVSISTPQYGTGMNFKLDGDVAKDSTVYFICQDVEGNQKHSYKIPYLGDLTTIREGAALGATALQSYTETDPTVPAWAKAENPPTPLVFSGGEAGLVPASTAGETDKYLRSDGTWAEVVGGGGGEVAEGAAIQTVTLHVSADELMQRTFTNTVGTNIDKVRNTMVVQQSIIPNKSQNKDWTIVTGNGSITIIGEIERDGEVTLILGDTRAPNASEGNVHIVHSTAMDYHSGDLIQFRAVGIGISSSQISVMWPAPFKMRNVKIVSASASATGIGTLNSPTQDTARTNDFALGFLINYSSAVANRAYLVLISAYLTFDRDETEAERLPEVPKRVYHVGDTYSVNYLVTSAFITSSRTNLKFSLPITVGTDVTGFKFVGGRMHIRENGRYLAFSASHAAAEVLDTELNKLPQTIERGSEHTRLTLNASGGFYVYNSTTTATNNVCCSLAFEPTGDSDYYIQFT